MFLGCSPCCGGGCETHQEKFGFIPSTSLSVSWGLRHVVYSHTITGTEFPTYGTNPSSPTVLRFDNTSSFSTDQFTYQVAASLLGNSLRITFTATPDSAYFSNTLGFDSTPITGLYCNFTEFPCYQYTEVYPSLGTRINTANTLLLEINQPDRYIRSTTNIIRGRLSVHDGETYVPSFAFPDATRVHYAIGGAYKADPSATGFPGSFPWDHRFTMQNIDQDQPARFSTIESLWQIVIYDVQTPDGTSVGLFHTRKGTQTPTLLSQQ